MSLINPSNLYSEGNVSLDSSPYTKIVLAQRARKEAQDEALNKHYENLPNTINDKGVRDQEIPVIHDAVNKLQRYWAENKEPIKKGNTPEAYNYGKMLRETRGVAQMSTNETGKTKKLYGLKTNPKYDYVFKDKNLIEAIRRSELPVNDPEFQSLDIDKFMLPPKPFDPNEYVKNFKDIKPTETIEVVPNPNDKYTQIQRTKPALDENAKLVIAQRAADNLVDNPSFESHIKGKMEKDPTLLPQIQKAFKDAYGRDINPMLADHDIAIGYTLLILPNMGAKEKIIPNTDARYKAKNAEWDRRNRITFGQSMQKIAANKAAGLAAPETGYLSDSVADEVGENVDLPAPIANAIGLAPGTQVKLVYADKVDPVRLDLIRARDISKRQAGVDGIMIPQPNGKDREAFVVNLGTGDWIGKGGEPISRERVKDDYINKNSASKLKSQMNTKASENTKGGTQKEMTLAEKMKAAKKQK